MAWLVTDEEYYTNATEFRPERWYSQPELIKHKNAFAPFSLGSENCIGKNRTHSPVPRPLRSSPASLSSSILTDRMCSGDDRNAHPHRPAPAQLRRLLRPRRGRHEVVDDDQGSFHPGVGEVGLGFHTCEDLRCGMDFLRKARGHHFTRGSTGVHAHYLYFDAEKLQSELGAALSFRLSRIVARKLRCADRRLLHFAAQSHEPAHRSAT